MISSDLTYDSYCNQSESEKVERILNERSKMEEKLKNYGYLIDDIEGVLEAKTTTIERLDWIKELINDFRKDNS